MEGFWFVRLVGFRSVIVASPDTRRCPFFLSSVSTRDYEKSRGWRGGYKLLSPVSLALLNEFRDTRPHSGSSLPFHSSFNLIGCASRGEAGTYNGSDGVTWMGGGGEQTSLYRFLLMLCTGPGCCVWKRFRVWEVCPGVQSGDKVTPA